MEREHGELLFLSLLRSVYIEIIALFSLITIQWDPASSTGNSQRSQLLYQFKIVAAESPIVRFPEWKIEINSLFTELGIFFCLCTNKLYFNRTLRLLSNVQSRYDVSESKNLRSIDS